MQFIFVAHHQRLRHAYLFCHLIGSFYKIPHKFAASSWTKNAVFRSCVVVVFCVSFFLSFSIYFISCCWNFIHELPNSIFDEPNMFDISCVCCVLLHRGANKVCTLASIKSFHFISFIFVKSQNHWNWWNKMLHKSFEEEHWMVWWYFRRDSNHHRMLRFVYRGRER